LGERIGPTTLLGLGGAIMPAFEEAERFRFLTLRRSASHVAVSRGWRGRPVVAVEVEVEAAAEVEAARVGWALSLGPVGAGEVGRSTLVRCLPCLL